MSYMNKLARSMPEQQGINSASIIAYLEGIKHYKLEMHSFMLLKNGAVVAEAWWHPYSKDIPHEFFSACKRHRFFGHWNGC